MDFGYDGKCISLFRLWPQKLCEGYLQIVLHVHVENAPFFSGTYVVLRYDELGHHLLQATDKIPMRWKPLGRRINSSVPRYLLPLSISG